MSEIPGWNPFDKMSEEFKAEMKRRGLLIEMSHQEIGREISLAPEQKQPHPQSEPLLNAYALSHRKGYILLCDTGQILLAFKPYTRQSNQDFELTFSPNPRPLRYDQASGVSTIDDLVRLYRRLHFPVIYDETGKNLQEFRQPVMNAIERSCLISQKNHSLDYLQRKVSQVFFGK